MPARYTAYMLGFKFIKFQPNVYVLKYKNGKITARGAGLSFFYYVPTTSLAAIPMGSMEAAFIFEETTSDFQAITIQGQVTFRIADAEKISGLLNYGIDPRTRAYLSDDPEKLSQRILNALQVHTKSYLEGLELREALQSSHKLAAQLREDIQTNGELETMGVEVSGLSILALRPNQETARALEAATRERILKEADDAIYTRRNAAVEQERVIKENELNTEIAVENKIRQKKEAQMDAEKAVQSRKHDMEAEQLSFKTAQEEKKRELVTIAAENARASADAKAYEIGSVMKSLSDVKPDIIQALASMGMNPQQLIALAFRGLADRAGDIGQLNISPDLLRELMDGKPGTGGGPRKK